MHAIICIFRKFLFKSGRIEIHLGYFSIRFLKMKKNETMMVIDRQMAFENKGGVLFGPK